MGTTHSTLYYCDWCGAESTDSQKVIGNAIVRNHHGGSPRQEWWICDGCDALANSALSQVRLDRLMAGKEAGNKRLPHSVEAFTRK